MSFDDLFRKDRPNKTLQRTADQHCDFTMTDNLKLNMAFDTHRLAVADSQATHSMNGTFVFRES